MQQAEERYGKSRRQNNRLSADFRIKDVAVWEKWYGMQHACLIWSRSGLWFTPN